jgi:hypothetical protein
MLRRISAHLHHAVAATLGSVKTLTKRPNRASSGGVVPMVVGGWVEERHGLCRARIEAEFPR